MDEKKPPENPHYGVRLTGDELAAHQERFQPRQSASEYGPQGAQAASEYGPQGGAYPPPPSQQQPGYQPGFQQQPGPQQPYGAPYGQPGQPGQPFGGPQLQPEMAKEPSRPKVVDISFWSIIAAGISYLIAQLIVAALPNRGMGPQDIDMMESMLGPMMDTMPFDSIEGYLNSPMMTAAMIGQAVIFLVAYVLVALGIRNGWRSMRILGTIFAVLSLLNITFVSALAGVFSGLAIILGIVGIVYAWLPASTEYYRQKAWQKAAKKMYPQAPSR
ncbi:hypothetical protein GCM10009720_19590 [Yaniella flava]|uniref:Uncharacterized protein n=1 Tax=Yaniella flava TaxID=287930 RepID=A0ABP5G2M6_9MICC|nr:hypothetical protein [Micrococcaceae bacterium]